MEFGVINTDNTNRCATYVYLDFERTQSSHCQYFVVPMTFRQNSNQQDSYLNYKRQCLELSNAEQDVHGMTEALANAVPRAVFLFSNKKEIHVHPKTSSQQNCQKRQYFEELCV